MVALLLYYQLGRVVGRARDTVVIGDLHPLRRAAACDFHRRWQIKRLSQQMLLAIPGIV